MIVTPLYFYFVFMSKTPSKQDDPVSWDTKNLTANSWSSENNKSKSRLDLSSSDIILELLKLKCLSLVIGHLNGIPKIAIPIFMRTDIFGPISHGLKVMSIILTVFLTNEPCIWIVLYGFKSDRVFECISQLSWIVIEEFWRVITEAWPLQFRIDRVSSENF